MIIPPAKVALVRGLIADLYTRPFNESLIVRIADSVCALAEGQYFGFRIYRSDQQVVYSNNSPEFNSAYASVYAEDFLHHSVVLSRNRCVLRKVWPTVGTAPENQNFIRTMQTVRPISDMIYLPVLVHGTVVGHWGLGRAGRDGPCYSENEIELFNFVGSFLNDTFERSLLPPPVAEDVAYLDHRGQVVSMGTGIKAVFDDLQGCREAFLRAYQRYLHGNLRVGIDRMTLTNHGKRLNFLFQLFNPPGIPLRLDGHPYASVRLLAEPFGQDKAQTAAVRKLIRVYQFSPREGEVVHGILEGKMNKEIASELGIEEATVKWYTHSVYEKTGFRSRTELVLGLSGSANPN